MEIHRLVAFSASAMLHKSRVTALDLDTATSFLLDMLDVSASMTYNLCSQIEPRKWLEVDWYTLFWPFALGNNQPVAGRMQARTSYTSKLISFYLVWFPTSETPLINQIWKLLLHKFLDSLNRLFETVFRDAGDVKV